MQYASLAYVRPGDTDRAARPIPGPRTALPGQPNATGWAYRGADKVRLILEGRRRGA